MRSSSAEMMRVRGLQVMARKEAEEEEIDTLYGTMQVRRLVERLVSEESGGLWYEDEERED